MNSNDWPLEGLDPAPIHAAIAASRCHVERFTDYARDALRAGKLHAVTGWAQIAADFAWNSHPGFYVSALLENMLLEVAQGIDRVPLRFAIDIPGKESSRKR